MQLKRSEFKFSRGPLLYVIALFLLSHFLQFFTVCCLNKSNSFKYEDFKKNINVQ